MEMVATVTLMLFVYAGLAALADALDIKTVDRWSHRLWR